MEGRDAKLLAASGNVLCRQHGSVWRGLVTVSLDLHATGDTGDSLATGQIGDVDEGVIEGRENAGNAENELALADLGSKLDVLRSGTLDLLLGRHLDCSLVLDWLFRDVVDDR